MICALKYFNDITQRLTAQRKIRKFMNYNPCRKFVAKRLKKLQAFAIPLHPDFKVAFMQACWKKIIDTVGKVKDCLSSQKKLNREAPYLKISKYEKSKSILLQLMSCHLNLYMAKIASSKMRRNFILTSIKKRKFSCMFTQHQNKLSERGKD